MPDTRTLPSQTRHRVKRKRGGQTGNQNARKHGFYSRTLSPAQASELFHITNVESTGTEEAVFRLKLRSVLHHDPGNRRVIREAFKVIRKWLCARYQLGHADTIFLTQFFRSVLSGLDNLSPRNNEFQQNESICSAENKSGRRVRKNTFNKTNRTHHEN